MLNTDYKIIVIPVYSDIKGIPPRNQHNRHIDILVKAKTMKRCMEIYSQVMGYREYNFTDYNRKMGHNKSDNTHFIEIVDKYEECVMYNLDWVRGENGGFKLFDGFENKLRNTDAEKVFKLNVSDNLKDIMENGISFDKLLKQ